MRKLENGHQEEGIRNRLRIMECNQEEAEAHPMLSGRSGLRSSFPEDIITQQNPTKFILSKVSNFGRLVLQMHETHRSLNILLLVYIPTGSG